MENTGKPMPYVEMDAAIVRITADWGLTRKEIFSGPCYLLNGNMLCYFYKNSLILRLGESTATSALQEPFIKPARIADRSMVGWVMIEPAVLEHGSSLEHWLKHARSFVANLAFEFYGQ